jgi:hypothetical protein
MTAPPDADDRKGKTMALEGLDVGAVRTLSTQMTSSASQIRQIMTSLTSQSSNIPWVGPDQKRFEGDWRGTYCGQLQAVINGLEHAELR